MSAEPVSKGSCLCGNFSFVTWDEPLNSVYCHCVDCRKSTGAPVSVLVGHEAASVEYTGEKPREHRSSEGVTRAFCSTCGGSVSYEDELLPGEIYLHIGLFDDPESFPPTTHSWHSQAIDWLCIEDYLPRHQQSSWPR